MESTSCELALKPGLYNINPIIHTLIPIVRGTTVFRATQSHQGETPTFRASGVSPGENTHIPRTSVSPEVNTHFGCRVSGASQ